MKYENKFNKPSFWLGVVVGGLVVACMQDFFPLNDLSQDEIQCIYNALEEEHEDFILQKCGEDPCLSSELEDDNEDIEAYFKCKDTEASEKYDSCQFDNSFGYSSVDYLVQMPKKELVQRKHDCDY